MTSLIPVYLAHSAQHCSGSSFGAFQMLVSIPLEFQTVHTETLTPFAAQETVFPSLTWATYYAVYIELTCCFMIACLPSIRQLIDKKILPTIRNYSTAMSSRYKSSRAETTTASSRLVINKTQETRVTTSALDPYARKDDDWNPDRKESRTSRLVEIR